MQINNKNQQYNAKNINNSSLVNAKSVHNSYYQSVFGHLCKFNFIINVNHIQLKHHIISINDKVHHHSHKYILAWTQIFYF